MLALSRIERRALIGGMLMVPFARRAFGQAVSSAPSSFVQLFESQGGSNGADITEDTLATFTMAPGQLANVGDIIHCVASGVFNPGSTDNKVVKIKLALATAGSISAAAAANLIWYLEVWIMKTGTNTQRFSSLPMFSGGTGTSQLGNATGSGADATALPISITGQNLTNPVAGSVVCNYFSIDYRRAA